MLFIGESINASIESVADAIIERDSLFIRNLARRQVQAGADFLDINAGTGRGDEVSDLRWAVRIAQEEVNVPISIDSSDPDAVGGAVEVHRGVPMINSISAEKRRLERFLPIVESGPECKVVALCVGDDGIPDNAEDRVSLAEFLVARLQAAGMNLSDIYVDTVTLSVGSNDNSARLMLDALQSVRDVLPEVQTIAAVSNVGFGLPRRKTLNRVLSVLAVEREVDALLCDVTDTSLLLAARATALLMGRDPHCISYLRAYRDIGD